MSRFLEAVGFTVSVFDPGMIEGVQINILRVFGQVRADRKWKIFNGRVRHRGHSG
ncbi:MAG TPA: hypothetical protein VMU69_23625 [Bradyrhizobium sp.]|nr:hypothetical protein [Bradyrhizobium sp.]